MESLHKPHHKGKPTPRIRCTTCSTGHVEMAGQSCGACWDMERRERAIRARNRRVELIARWADQIEATPEEVVELLVEIARCTQGGAT